MLHIAYFSIVLSVFCVQICGASELNVAQPAADANSDNAQAQERIRVRQRFSEDEDAWLRILVERHGTSNWSLIAREMGNHRPLRQYRDRWNNYLNPRTVTRICWVPEEGAYLCQSVDILGRRSAHIGNRIVGPADEVMNRYRQILCQRERIARQHNSDISRPDSDSGPDSYLDPAPDVDLSNHFGTFLRWLNRLEEY
ncbi:MAG: hypothetical protein LBR89_02255 [Holosporales bacterium]|jgi:hypothetical protein|nr:hypothetical protein [Holosporales bacterium]